MVMKIAIFSWNYNHYNNHITNWHWHVAIPYPRNSFIVFLWQLATVHCTLWQSTSWLENAEEKWISSWENHLQVSMEGFPPRLMTTGYQDSFQGWSQTGSKSFRSECFWVQAGSGMIPYPPWILLPRLHPDFHWFPIPAPFLGDRYTPKTPWPFWVKNLHLASIPPSDDLAAHGPSAPNSPLNIGDPPRVEPQSLTKTMCFEASYLAPSYLAI